MTLEKFSETRTNFD